MKKKISVKNNKANTIIEAVVCLFLMGIAVWGALNMQKTSAETRCMVEADILNNPSSESCK